MLWQFNPMKELERMQSQINSLMSGYERECAGCSFPLTNVYEDDEKVTMVAELPGVTKENVSISMQDRVLNIKGSRPRTEAENKMNAIRRERSVGEFEKSYKIPTDIIAEKISAEFKHGILTITLPKAEEAKPRKIEINT